ncbi:MAG: hypothetical protein ABI843_09805 [Dokdonella sp.]
MPRPPNAICALDFAALLWRLGASGSESLPARFERHPQPLRNGSRSSGIDAARSVLFVQQLRARHYTRFELPPAPCARHAEAVFAAPMCRAILAPDIAC